MHGKIWASRRGVQLIVFFAAIREILKKEIYARDKQRFCLMKIKGKLVGSRRSAAGLQIKQIRFVNRSRFAKLPSLTRLSNRATDLTPGMDRNPCVGRPARILSSHRF